MAANMSGSIEELLSIEWGHCIECREPVAEGEGSTVYLLTLPTGEMHNVALHSTCLEASRDWEKGELLDEERGTYTVRPAPTSWLGIASD